MTLGASAALAVAVTVHALAFGEREGVPRPLYQHGRDHATKLNRNVRGSRQAREACRHWQHVGCLGDVLEKTCDTDGEFVEIAIASMLAPHDRESMWSCCCPRPYQPCAREEADGACLRSMMRHFAPVAARLRADAAAAEARSVRLLRPLVGAVRGAILGSRAELIASEPRCAACLGGTTAGAASATAAAAAARGFCGGDGRPRVARTIRDNVLFCETVTWQWESLGDGSRREFRRNACPLPATPLDAAGGEGGGDARKGRRGWFDVPEVWPTDARCSAAFAAAAEWEQAEERHEAQLRALQHVLRVGGGAKHLIMQRARRASQLARERQRGGGQRRVREALRDIERLKCDSFVVKALWADPSAESTRAIEM